MPLLRQWQHSQNNLKSWPSLTPHWGLSNTRWSQTGMFQNSETNHAVYALYFISSFSWMRMRMMMMMMMMMMLKMSLYGLSQNVNAQYHDGQKTMVGYGHPCHKEKPYSPWFSNSLTQIIQIHPNSRIYNHPLFTGNQPCQVHAWPPHCRRIRSRNRTRRSLRPPRTWAAWR